MASDATPLGWSSNDCVAQRKITDSYANGIATLVLSTWSDAVDIAPRAAESKSKLFSLCINAGSEKLLESIFNSRNRLAGISEWQMKILCLEL